MEANRTARPSRLTFSNLHSVSPRFSDAILSQRDNSLIKFISNLEAILEADTRRVNMTSRLSAAAGESAYGSFLRFV